MVLMNLANFSQYEREMTSERTRAAFQYMKAQGVASPAPYGYELSHDPMTRTPPPVPLDQNKRSCARSRACARTD